MLRGTAPHSAILGRLEYPASEPILAGIPAARAFPEKRRLIRTEDKLYPFTIVYLISPVFSRLISEKSKNQQLFRGPRQVLAAVGRDGNHVFDTHAEFAGHIDARFHGDDLALRQYGFAAAGQVGPLVDFQAHAMAGAMVEIRAVARFFNGFPGGAVGLGAGKAGTQNVQGGALGL